MKTRKKKQLTLYDVRRRRHLLIRRKRKSLTYRIVGMSVDAAAALFAVATCIRTFNEIFKGKE